MLGLRQQIGSHIYWIATSIGYNTYLRWASRHIYSHIMKRDLLLGSHNILIAWAKYLVDLRHCLGAISHSSDSLYTTYLIYSIDTRYLGSRQYSRIYITLFVGRCAEHYILTSGNLGRCCKH